MTTMRVSAQEVAALGVAVADVALFVATTPDVIRATRWASGPGETGDALEDLVGNWEHQRHVLGRGLDGLARAALEAGEGYARVEARAGRLVGGGSSP